MKVRRLAASFVACVFLISVLFAVCLPSADAAGVQVFRTDSQGRKTGTVLNVGNTGPNAFCVGAGIGAVGYGVAVCYL